MKELVTANSVAIPTPSHLTVYPNLREDSTENSLGDIIRKIISCRWKLEMKWNYLTAEQYQMLEDLKFLYEFECEFPKAKGRITRTMYAGDIKAEAQEIDDNGNVIGWINASLNFVQRKATKN